MTNTHTECLFCASASSCRRGTIFSCCIQKVWSIFSSGYTLEETGRGWHFGLACAIFVMRSIQAYIVGYALGSTLWNSLRLYVSEIPQNSHLCVQPLTGIVCILNGQHTQLQSKQRTVPEMKGRERRGFYVYLVLSIQPAVVVGCVLGASGNVSNVQMHIMSLEKHIRLMRWLNKRLFKRNWGKIFANTMQHNSVYEWEINSRSYKSVHEIIVHRLIFLFVSCGDTYCKFRHKWHTQTGLSLCKLGSKIAYAASDPIRNVSHLSKYPVFQMVIIFS